MQNKFFRYRENKSVAGISNKNKIEKQWKNLTQSTKSNPSVEYRQNPKIIIRKKSTLLQEDKFENQKISMNELTVFKSIFQETQKQSEALEKIALGLESLKDVVNILDKIFNKISVQAVKEELNFKANETSIKISCRQDRKK